MYTGAKTVQPLSDGAGRGDWESSQGSWRGACWLPVSRVWASSGLDIPASATSSHGGAGRPEVGTAGGLRGSTTAGGKSGREAVLDGEVPEKLAVDECLRTPSRRMQSSAQVSPAWKGGMPRLKHQWSLAQ